MASVNRFTEAQPAKDNYFNTFVPLPMQELTALGMSRKQDLEKNQAMLDKAYNDAIDIKYIKQSPFEEANYRKISKGVSDLAMEYANTDLSNAQEMSNLRRKLRTVVDPTLVKRMEESALNYEHRKALEMDMRSKGTWNDLLNEDPAATHNSTTGVYNYMPEAYFGKEKLLDPYVKDLKPSFKTITKDGMMIMSVDDADIARIANPDRVQELLSTPAGRQEVKLFKRQYPNSAEGKSDNEIMTRILTDYAEQKKQVIVDPIPEYMAKARGIGAQPKPPRRPNPMYGSNPTTPADNYDSIEAAKANVIELRKVGDPLSVQQAADLEDALKMAAKKNNLDLSKYRDSEQILKNPKIINKLLDIGQPKDVSETHKKEAAVLDEIGSKMTTKYSFGMARVVSGDLAKSVGADGKPVGLDDISYISNDIVSGSGSYEITSINDDPGLSKKEKAAAMLEARTDNLIGARVGLLPVAENEYKTSLRLSYQNKDGKVTNITTLLNDATAERAVADALVLRGDYVGSTAIYQKHVAQTIDTDNFEVGKPVTHYLYGVDESGNRSKDWTELNITKVNDSDKGMFKIEYEGASKPTYAVNRKELSAKIYDLISRSSVTFEKDKIK